MDATQHARIRMQQRSIPPLITDWLDLYGEEIPAPYGGVIRYFGKQSRRLIRDEEGSVLYRKLESLFNAYAVICGGRIITVGRRYKKLKA